LRSSNTAVRKETRPEGSPWFAKFMSARPITESCARSFPKPLTIPTGWIPLVSIANYDYDSVFWAKCVELKDSRPTFSLGSAIGWGRSHPSIFQLYLQTTIGKFRRQRPKAVCKGVVPWAEFQVRYPELRFWLFSKAVRPWGEILLYLRSLIGHWEKRKPAPALENYQTLQISIGLFFAELSPALYGNKSMVGSADRISGSNRLTPSRGHPT